MTTTSKPVSHAAVGPALGYYYQALYALLMLLKESGDEASVSIETADDVELKDKSITSLVQLKHSMNAASKITEKSDQLWSALKVWIDGISVHNALRAKLVLASVASFSDASPLNALLQPPEKEDSRANIRIALEAEAHRVISENEAAKAQKKADPKLKIKIPHQEKYPCCKAYLALSEATRRVLIDRIIAKPSSPQIQDVEEAIASALDLVRPNCRSEASKRLVQWWDREVIRSLFGGRDRFITKEELQHKYMEVIAIVHEETLVPDFETANHPIDYEPDSMLVRQIKLVGGTDSDIKRAIREEWRAREQRSKWSNERVGMKSEIEKYDFVLIEHWNDMHEPMREGSQTCQDSEKMRMGYDVLRWSHYNSYKDVRPIKAGVAAPYFIRGSYQVLAIEMSVGWHPEYKERLAKASDE